MSVYPASKHCYLFDVYSDVPQDIGYWFRMRDHAVSNDFHSLLPPANEVWGKVIFLHQFVILFTGGACVVAPGRGACVVAPGGHVWLHQGACVVLFGGHAWFYLGVRGFIWGVNGFIWGACMVLFGGGGHAWFYSGGYAWFYLGGMRGFFSFFGYNEIRSMSRRYASYWNAFLYRVFSPKDDIFINVNVS